MTSIKSILLLGLLAFVGCNTDKKSEIQSSLSPSEEQSGIIYLSKSQFENAKMKIGSLVEKPFSQTVHTNGVIDVPPQNKAVVSAFSGGYINNTPLLIGDKVKKGDRLVTLENPEFITMQQNYLETVEQLSYLKSEHDRQKTMFEENITSQKNFLRAESEYRTAMARANSLKKNLQMLNIDPASVVEGKIVSQASVYSPIDGYVTKVMINTGSYVSPADMIMEIINTDHIHLELKVFEKNILKLKKGQEILFRVPEASQEDFKGELYLVGTTIDPKNRVAMVHGHIEEKLDLHFSVGMFIEADIVTGTTPHMALPDDAVVELEGTTYVLMLESEEVDNYKLRPIEVKVGSSYNGFTSFASPLPADGKFLTKGAFVLLQE